MSNPDVGQAWCTRRFQDLMAPLLAEEEQEAALEFIGKRRVLDFLVEPGFVSARIEPEEGRAKQIVISFKPLTDDQWLRLLEVLAQKAYFLAQLLANSFPEEISHACEEVGISLVPESLADIGITVDGVENREASSMLAAVVLRFLAELDAEPFILFTILGRGKEETLAELRRMRMVRSESSDRHPAISSVRISYESSPSLENSVERFWDLDPGVFELQYTIKADELPASILKWLEPIPLNGLEERVDFLVEDAYAKVARLAQGFGLGL